MNGCQPCHRLHRDMQLSQDLLKRLPLNVPSHETVLRIMGASQDRRKSIFYNPKFRTVTLGLVMPLLILAVLVSAFPNYFAWAWAWRKPQVRSQFVRYYPLFQGATEIVQEQGASLLATESFAGSLWEEGGLSPEDFEKTFQRKRLKESP